MQLYTTPKRRWVPTHRRYPVNSMIDDAKPFIDSYVYTCMHPLSFASSRIRVPFDLPLHGWLSVLKCHQTSSLLWVCFFVLENSWPHSGKRTDVQGCVPTPAPGLLSESDTRFWQMKRLYVLYWSAGGVLCSAARLPGSWTQRGNISTKG